MLLSPQAYCMHMRRCVDSSRQAVACMRLMWSACLNGCVLQVLVGIVTEEGAREAVLELLLSHLVPPKSQENPLACQYVCLRGRRQQSAVRGMRGASTPRQLCHQPMLPFVVPSRAVLSLFVVCYCCVGVQAGAGCAEGMRVYSEASPTEVPDHPHPEPHQQQLRPPPALLHTHLPGDTTRAHTVSQHDLAAGLCSFLDHVPGDGPLHTKVQRPPVAVPPLLLGWSCSFTPQCPRCCCRSFPT